MTTLTDYNNNPGNIRPAKGVKYDGMIGVDDKGFAVFETPKAGQQALNNDLTHKIEKRGIKTPSDFVDVYSPAGKENDEDARENYKIYIAQKLGLKSTHDEFPENAVPKLAQAVSNFESGKWQESQEKDPEQSSAPPSSSEEPKEVPGEQVPQGNNDSNADESTLPQALVGGYLGAKVAGGIEATKKFAPLVPGLINKVSGSTPNPTKPMARWGLQNYLNSQIAPNLKMPLSELEKVAGGNKIRTMAEVQNALKAIQEVKSERVAKTTSINPATGQPRQVFTTTPGRPAVDLSKYERTPSIFSNVAEEAANAGRIVKGALPSVARVGFGALGGALAGSQLYDAFKDYEKEGEGLHMPSGRTAAKFASGAGGALSVLPFGVTQAAGLALQAPELAYQASDYVDTLKERRKNATKEDTDRMLMNVDPMGNPM
jgi:hypothetical protein